MIASRLSKQAETDPEGALKQPYSALYCASEGLLPLTLQGDSCPVQHTQHCLYRKTPEGLGGLGSGSERSEGTQRALKGLGGLT